MELMQARKTARLGLMALMMASLVVGTLPTVGQTEPSQGRQWEMKYEEGSEKIGKGDRVKVTVGKDTITCDCSGAGALSIPVAKVVEVSYDTKARRRVAEGAIVAGALSLGIGTMIMFMKTTKHFVNIIWDDAGNKREMVLKVGKGDYAGFLGDLERATGKPYKNLAMQRKVTQEALKQEKANRMPVQLDRAVKVGEADLKPGLHQMVVLEHAGNPAELYFFAGNDVNEKKVAAVALVEVTAQTEQVSATHVHYVEAGGSSKISEIHTTTKIFRML